MTVITMSRNELTRLRVLIDVADGRLSVADATGLIGVGRRQIYRLLQAFRARGADGLISRKRGGPSNRALGSLLRETVQRRRRAAIRRKTRAIPALPIRSRPRLDELRDDAGPGRGALWGYCPRNRAHHQS